MEIKGFKSKCANCGKEVILMIPGKKNVFCNKMCEKNFKYSDKFIDDRYWKGTPFKEE